MNLEKALACKETFAGAMSEYPRYTADASRGEWYKRTVSACIKQYGVEALDAVMGAFVYQYRYATAPYRPNDEIIIWAESLHLPEELKRNPDKYSPVSAHYGDDAALMRILLYHYHAERSRQEPSGENEKQTIWLRVGGNISVTKAEAKAILGEGNNSMLREVVLREISNGTFVPDGDTYIPESCVEIFNEKYGTAYPTTDVECCL